MGRLQYFLVLSKRAATIPGSAPSTTRRGSASPPRTCRRSARARRARPSIKPLRWSNLGVCAGALSSGTQVDANALSTRCYVGGEITTAYEIATLTAPMPVQSRYLVRARRLRHRGRHRRPSPNAPCLRASIAPLSSKPTIRAASATTVYLKFDFNAYSAAACKSLGRASHLSPVRITGAALASPLPSSRRPVLQLQEGGFQEDLLGPRSTISATASSASGARAPSAWDSAQFIRAYAHPPFVA